MKPTHDQTPCVRTFERLLRHQMQSHLQDHPAGIAQQELLDTITQTFAHFCTALEARLESAEAQRLCNAAMQDVALHLDGRPTGHLS